MQNPSIWFDIFLAGALAKFACALITQRWPGGSAAILKTWPGRLAYFTGKITPLIAIGAVLIYYKLTNQTVSIWWFIAAFVALLIYVTFVVWYRLSGRWSHAG
jgi:hypothetical protein